MKLPFLKERPAKDGKTLATEDGRTDDFSAESALILSEKKKFKWKRVIIGFAVLLIGIAAAFMASRFLSGMRPVAELDINYVTQTVSRQDITDSLSGSGSLEPADSYTVTNLVSGEILSASFEEGDIVEKDTMLYQVDNSNVATSIERAELSLAQARRSYEQKLKALDDLKIRANRAGTIIELLVEKGDTVQTGQTIAIIRESGTMSLVIPFGADDAAGFRIGDNAEVTLDGSFERISGVVSKIGAVDRQLAGNMIVRDVTIEVQNPGGISDGMTATAMVGPAACNGSGTFSFKEETTVTASASGEVETVHVKEGDTVRRDQLIISLESDTLVNDIENSRGSLRDSELSLKNQYDQLDNYTINSPISGTIIEKHYKEGDNLETGKTLCVIFDLSYLTMTLNVDELDISKISVGQPVTITAEAITGRTYEGVVTKININGTTTNGTTAYPVTVRIDETEGLLPGMNVDAEIIISSKKGVLALPNSAVMRGGRVLLKTDPNAPEPVMGEAGMPVGYEYVEVELGVSNEEYIEVVSGIKEGDVIAYIELPAVTGSQPNIVVGGPMGGGPPQGGGATYRTDSAGNTTVTRVGPGG